MDYTVQTNQSGQHQHLEKTVEKHWNTDFLRPIPEREHTIFQELHKKVTTKNCPIILDSCCGTAKSSHYFAKQHPDHLIIAIDKSHHRLSKQTPSLDNLLIVQANVYDLWRLIATAQWPIKKHYLLYPNPWPKAEQLNKRFHGHPCFKTLMQLSPELELRSNWRTYLDEFATACQITKTATTTLNQYAPNEGITAFETKYLKAGQPLYQLCCQIPENRNNTTKRK